MREVFAYSVLQSPKKVGDDIAKGTKDWKGLKITVQLTIENRKATVSVVPTASALVIRALKEPSRDRKKVKNGEILSSQLLHFLFSSLQCLRVSKLSPLLGRHLSFSLSTLLATSRNKLAQLP